jgi:hypothetical protein
VVFAGELTPPLFAQAYSQIEFAFFFPNIFFKSLCHTIQFSDFEEAVGIDFDGSNFAICFYNY